MGTMARIRALEGQARLFYKDIAAAAALLDGAGQIVVQAGDAKYQYKVRDIKLVGGGVNFGVGGDRLLGLTDGATVWTTVPNANLEAAPAVSLPWGNAAVPLITGTANTKSVAGANIRLQYSGGTTDHAGAGAITFQICLERFPV